MTWKEHVPVGYGAGLEKKIRFFPGKLCLMNFCCALTVPVLPTSGPIDCSSPKGFSDGFGGCGWPNMGPPAGFGISHRFSSTCYGVAFATADAP